MTILEDDAAAPAAEQRAKYTQSQINELGVKGHAFKNPDGSYSYPVDDEQDLANAIHAVGRGNADHDAIRKYIIARAKAMGLSSKIPENWAADGSLKQQNNADDDELEDRTVVPEVERRRQRVAELDGAREVRHFDADVEVRELSDGTFRFSGYASVTEHPYEVADFTETIARGAFKRTLGEQPDVVLLVNHGEGGGLPLARTKSGTMTLTEDARGLRVDADLNPNDPDVRSLVPKMQRGDVDQMSFAFRVTDQEWSEDYSRRMVRSVALHRGDVSIVTMGANPATTSTITARQLEDALVEVRSGAAISAANMDILGQALKLVSTADDAVDEAQPLLARVMGVPNPDADDKDASGEGESEGESEAPARSLPSSSQRRLDYTTEARAWLESVREERR